MMNLKPLLGIQSIQSLEAQDGCIQHRNLSTLDTSTYSDYVDVWKQHKFHEQVGYFIGLL